MKPETYTVLEGIITACIFGTWVVLGISGFFLFYLGRDVAFKRKWFPRYIVLANSLGVFLSTTLIAHSSRSPGTLNVLMIIAPAVCLISYLNIKLTRFCDRCGSTLYNQGLFPWIKFCPRCGAELDAKPKSYDDLLE
jgi:hypothetical protein